MARMAVAPVAKAATATRRWYACVRLRVRMRDITSLRLSW